MLVSTLFDRINYALRGIDDDTPAEGSEEATYWLSVINRKKDEWAYDPNENWSSLFAKRTLADPIAAATQSYNLDSDFIRPSDDVFVEVGSKTITHKLVEPQLRDTGDVYITGKTLNFNETIEATDERVGGDIVVPGFYLPTDLDAFTDPVPVDDPNWLAVAVAAELAFSDVTYEDKYSDLVGMANDLYLKMKSANRKGTITSPRAIRTSVNRIGNSGEW